MNIISYKEFCQRYPDINDKDVIEDIDKHLRGKVTLGCNILYDEWFVLATLIKEANPKLIIETGTNQGISTIALAVYTDAKIITYDIPHMKGNPDRSVDYDAWGRAFRDSIFELQIEKRAQSTFDIDVTKLPVADVWFIDSGHSWKYVENETRMARENMKEHGLLIWHDANPVQHFSNCDVNKYLNEFYPDATLISTSYGVAYYKY
jgi:predicted O-methyltransferase YrrM